MKAYTLNIIRRTVFRYGDGEGGDGGTGGSGTGNPPPQPQPRSFSQDEVNRFLADERRKFQSKIQGFEDLQTKLNLTEQQKTEFEQQLETMRGELQTKEEQQTQALTKLQKKYDTDIAAGKNETATWRQRFETKLKDVEILASAAKFNAFNPTQIQAILGPQTTVTEELGGDGRPTGNFVARVKFKGRDKDKKEIELTLSVEDAVKAMTEMPDVYGNLFKSASAGGTGSQPTGGGNTGGSGDGDIPDIASMKPQDYAKYREKIRAQMRKA